MAWFEIQVDTTVQERHFYAAEGDNEAEARAAYEAAVREGRLPPSARASESEYLAFDPLAIADVRPMDASAISRVERRLARRGGRAPA